MRDNPDFNPTKTVVWETPSDFYQPLDEEFGFTCDVCALPENTKCPMYFTPNLDGLTQAWKGVCWMNPPYGRGIDKWVHKAYASSQEGTTVVCLLPSRTGTKWFQDYCLKYGEIRFVRGRLKFGNSEFSKGDCAPFDCVVVIFRPDNWLAELE